MSLVTLFLTTSISLGLPPSLLDSVCWAESLHKPRAYRKQDGVRGQEQTPSLGICQVKRSTCTWLGVKGKLMDPANNIECAGRYLKYQLTRYKGDYVRAVVAYNKGHSSRTKGNAYSRRVLEYYRTLTKSQDWGVNPGASSRKEVPYPLYENFRCCRR